MITFNHVVVGLEDFDNVIVITPVCIEGSFPPIYKLEPDLARSAIDGLLQRKLKI